MFRKKGEIGNYPHATLAISHGSPWQMKEGINQSNLLQKGSCARARIICICMWDWCGTDVTDVRLMWLMWDWCDLPGRVYYGEMEPYSCVAFLCVSACLIIGGMMAFRAFKNWKKEFTRLKIVRPRNILWKPRKEAVENNCRETCCKTVSYSTPTIILQKL